MGKRRTINGDSQRAYRVVKDAYGVVRHLGPYSTLSAAKGIKTREERYAKYYGRGEPFNIWIEQTPEGWEKVDAK